MRLRLTRVLLASALTVLALLAQACSAPVPPPRTSPPRASKPALTAAETLAPQSASGQAEAPEEAPDKPGWLGVQLGTVPAGEPGVLVQDTVPGSPAAQAGLVPGDVILSVDGEPAQDPPGLAQLVSSHRAGQRIALVFLRGGTRRLAGIELGQTPTDNDLMHKTYVGSPAPALRALKTVQGSVEPDLARLRGKVVVVEFWATWCFVCRMLVPVMNQWHERYAAQGVELIGITSEAVVPAAQAANSLGMLYPIASDETGRTTLAYRALALPTVFVIDRTGTVRNVMVGYSSERLAELEASIQRLLAG
jgi:thiol-disulfide isomerase/thioredoxin